MAQRSRFQSKNPIKIDPAIADQMEPWMQRHQNIGQSSALINAILRDDEPALHKLITATGADPNQIVLVREASNVYTFMPLLQLAILLNHASIAHTLLDLGASPNSDFNALKNMVKKSESSALMEMDTPILHHALALGDVGLVKKMIDRKVDINQMDWRGQHSLFHTQDPSLLSLLIKNGAHIGITKKESAEGFWLHDFFSSNPPYNDETWNIIKGVIERADFPTQYEFGSLGLCSIARGPWLERLLELNRFDLNERGVYDLPLNAAIARSISSPPCPFAKQDLLNLLKAGANPHQEDERWQKSNFTHTPFFIAASNAGEGNVHQCNIPLLTLWEAGVRPPNEGANLYLSHQNSMGFLNMLVFREVEEKALIKSSASALQANGSSQDRKQKNTKRFT